MAGKVIKAKETGVTPVENFDDMSVEEAKGSAEKKPKKNSKKGTAKSAVVKNSEVVENKKSSKKNTAESTEKSAKQCAKKGTKLVEKTAKQSGAEVKEEKVVVEKKLDDAVDSKPAKKMPMRDANGRFISAAKAAELEAEAKKAAEKAEKAAKKAAKAAEKKAKAEKKDAEKAKKVEEPKVEEPKPAKKSKAKKPAVEKPVEKVEEPKADEPKPAKKSKKSSKKAEEKPVETKRAADLIKETLAAKKAAEEAKADEPVVEEKPKTKKSTKKATKKSSEDAEVIKKAKMMAAVAVDKNPEEFKGMDLLISFDTTGSMYPVLSQVRKEVVKFIGDMQQEVTNLRIGIIAHGDYCDKDNPYTIRILDFTDDISKIADFVTNTKSTYGGDADECYELVLNAAHHVMEWRKDVARVMVMIGDANPHAPSYPQNINHLDWHKEKCILRDMGVKVFAVHALSYYRSSSKKFYEDVAQTTGGTYLTLDQFSEVTGLIMATCVSQYSTQKLDEYIEIVRKNGRMTNTMARNINRLYGREVIEGVKDEYTRTPTKRMPSGSKTDSTLVQKDGLVPIIPGRFQTMVVDSACDIRGFVTDNGITFKRGRAFYELSKAETVQQYKEVIIQDRETGEMFNGAQVREYLGLQPQIAAGGVKEKLRKEHTKDFRVFVQSTSVNRKLVPGTTLLYEVSDL